MLPRSLPVVALCLVPAVLPAGNWPQWRGPLRNGSTTESGLPESCDASTTLWTTRLPGPGHATPAVWEHRLLVTAAEPASDGVLALCLDARDGTELWRRRLGDDARAPRNNGATPSPATDGRHAWFLSGSGELVALGLDGQPLWTRHLARDYGNLATKFGYSSSPLLWDGRLYVQLLRRPRAYSGAAEADGALASLVLALDPLTGRELWRHARATPAVDESCEAYTTPVPFAHGSRNDLVIQGGDCLTGHDPATGAERWRFGYNPERETNWRVIPSPVAAGPRLVAMLPRGGPLVALAAGATGKLAADAPLWTYDERTSDSGSPLFYQGTIYILQSDRNDPWRRGSKGSTGIFLLAVDPATGRETGRCLVAPGGAWRASPTGADGRIYLLGEKGEVVVTSAGPRPRVLSRTDLDDGPACATVVAAGGRLFIRTASRITCFATTPPP